jgi:hypothetical protein
MSYATPEEAALAGDRTNSETRVLTSIRTTETSAEVVIASPGWPQPELVSCYLDASGWTEGRSGTGRTTWSRTDDDPEGIGLLVCWHEAEPGAHAVRISFSGRTIERPVENGFVIWAVNDIPEDRWDDPADFVWL